MRVSENSRTAVLSIATHVPGKKISTASMLESFEGRLSPELADTLLRLEVESRYSIVSNFPDYLAGKAPRELITTTTDLGIEAVKKCFSKADPKEKPIGLMMVATDTPNRPLPCLGYELLTAFPDEIPHDINIVNMQNQGCSVLPKMFEMAGYYLKANPERRALIVASEGHTGYAAPRSEPYFHGLRQLQELSGDKVNAVEELLEAFLFGDGAVAILLGADEESPVFLPRVGPFTHLTNQDRTDLELLSMNEGGVLTPTHELFPHYRMSRDVPKRGAFYAEHCVAQLLQKFSDMLAQPEDAAAFLIHTGSKKILDGVCKILGTEPNNGRVQSCYKILREYANLSACSIGFILEDSLQSKWDGVGLLVSFGVGFSGSAGVVSYRH